MFRVFEDGKRCDDHKITGWVGKDTFSLKRNAEVYAYMWAYAVTQSDAELYAPEMVLGVEYDYSLGECSYAVMMKIEEVDK